jgi:hypothetical protein
MEKTPTAPLRWTVVLPLTLSLLVSVGVPVCSFALHVTSLIGAGVFIGVGLMFMAFVVGLLLDGLLR